MSNEIVNYNPGGATLLEMRADPQRFPRIRTLTREQVVAGMVKIVYQALLYTGRTADPTNIQFTASALVDELLAADIGFKYLSLAEIQAVVKRAVLNTEMFVSGSALFRVIADYRKGEGKNNQSKVENDRRAKPNSPGMAMLQAATGDFIRNHKTK